MRTYQSVKKHLKKVISVCSDSVFVLSSEIDVPHEKLQFLADLGYIELSPAFDDLMRVQLLPKGSTLFYNRRMSRISSVAAYIAGIFSGIVIDSVIKLIFG